MTARPIDVVDLKLESIMLNLESICFRSAAATNDKLRCTQLVLIVTVEQDKVYAFTITLFIHMSIHSQDTSEHLNSKVNANIYSAISCVCLIDSDGRGYTWT